MQSLTELSPQRLALLALDLQKQLKKVEGAAREPIAIVGMACNLPGAPSVETYWDLLSSGRDAITEMPGDRWDTDAFYSPDPEEPGRYYTRHAGFIEDHDHFDPAFFGLSPLEAHHIDPQHRLLLETTWHALEDAGLPRNALEGRRVGNFVGISTTDYMQYNVRHGQRNEITPFLGTGNSASTAAGRVSYVLGLNGPSMAVDTACSSSLIATHLACQSLRLGESDVAIASGVNLMMIPDTFIYFCKLRALAADGRCKTFDAGADGYGRGEGAGTVILKRLSDARRDGDRIVALIRGSDMNHSGRSNGLTVPSGKAQEAVVRTALANAGMMPNEISFVEAHGTGTSLGDPIELHALGAVHCDRDHKLMIGSAKTNIGHLEAAAGIVGLIKTALSLYHRQLPAHLNLSRPNPHVDWNSILIDPVSRLTPLTAEKLAGGVSSFGFGGSNAHAVLEAADPAPTLSDTSSRTAHVLKLSARSATALKRLAEETTAAVGSDAAFADYCHSANTGRSDFEHRLSLRAVDGAEAANRLFCWLSSHSTEGISANALTVGHASEVAFLFSGQGAQLAGMGKRLYETHPVFRDSIDASSAYIGDRLGVPLPDLLWGTASDQLGDTQMTQPTLFAFEVALARLWMSFGVKPAMVLGHSVGEFAAAHVAGFFNLEDGLELVLARGRLMAELCSTGAMLAASCSEATALALLDGEEAEASIAAINSPNGIVLSGSFEAVDRMVAKAEIKGLRTKRLDVSHAFHSPLMEPALDAFAEVATAVSFTSPNMPVLSNVTGERASFEEMASPDYWIRHIREAVRFGDTVTAARKMGAMNFLEIGPRPVLLSAARQTLGEDPALLFLPSLQPPADDWTRLLDSLGALYASGVTVDWAGLDAVTGRKKVALPSYPFDRTRFWTDYSTSDRAPDVMPAGKQDLGPESPHHASGSGGQKAEPDERRIENFLYGTSWQPQKAPVLPPAIAGTVLILADESGVGEALADVVEACDARVVLARSGNAFSQDGDSFILRPGVDTDYAALLDEVGGGLAGVVHLWSLDADPSDPMAAQALGYASAFRLGQAISERSERIPRTMALLTRGAQSTGEDDPVPGFAQGTLWGLGRVFAMELAQARTVLIDLAPDADAGEAHWLAASLFGTHSETLLARRDGAGLVARLERRQDLPPIAPAEGGAWLITGGLGGIGMHLADWLATHGVMKIALVGRSGPNAAVAESIAGLIDDGVELLILQGDVTDAKDAARIVGAARDRFGPLSGLVHAAGTMDNASLADLDWSRCEAVLAPKLAGAWNMVRSMRADPLDHIVFFSSASSLLGSPGHGNYAPANAALDALAGHLRGQGLPAVAVNWGPWAGTGMAAQLSGEVRARWDAMGIWGSLEPDEALDGFSRAFAASAPQLAVMPTDWSKFFRVFPVGLEPPFLEEMAQQIDRLGPPSGAWAALLDRAADMRPELRRDMIAEFLEGELAAIMSLPPGTAIDHMAGFFDIGFDSLMTLELRTRLQLAVGSTLALPVTLAFDYPSIDRLTEWLDSHVSVVAPEAAPVATATGGDVDAPVAIVGIGCKFPGQAEDPESFWANLVAGRDCISEVPLLRWDADSYFDPDPDVPGRMITRYGGFVDDIEKFDASFFGVSPREAVQLDPQQRMLLETTWKAIEDANQPVECLRERPTGVFVGISINDYSQVLARSGDPARLDAYLGMGNATSMSAGRIAHFMGLEGPAIAIDTACSSSLTSLHMACEALRRGDCYAALAGGVNSVLAPEINVSLSKARMLAPDGRCKTFDASADGYVRGEGCGMVVLKLLKDAQADGDDIVAVIRASGINHDGRASGLTVPNGVAQERLLTDVLKRAGLTAKEVDYIEAHGTGTPLGDPIEVQAVSAVYGKDRGPEEPILIGTVKTNIGHLESAAGVAGTVKAALTLRHGSLPPSLNFQEPNPRIDWVSMPVQVADTLRSFHNPDRPMRIGVSSFGFSGTNAHMILEAAPPRPKATAANERSAHLMTLSARTPKALCALAGDIVEALAAPGAPDLKDLCTAANRGRSALPYRLSAVGHDADDMAAQLTRTAELAPTDMRTVQNRFAMIFSGQGAQVEGMGQGLYASEPRFAEALDRVAAVLGPHLDRPLKQLMWEDGQATLSQTEYTQPALFAVEYALAETWKAWGITPRLMIGHSIGEYAVAVQAGVMTLEDAGMLVAARGRLMHDCCPKGDMLALDCAVGDARRIVDETGGMLALAAMNGPRSCVLSGEASAIAKALGRAEALGLRATPLNVSHAFHSPLMEPMLEAFEAVADTVDFRPADCDVVSTLTGRRITAGEMSETSYWVRQIREPVLFADAILNAERLKIAAYVEIGPKPVLLGLVESSPLAKSVDTLPSLVPGRDEEITMLTTLGQLWTRGNTVDWRAFDAPFERRPAKLPATRFEREAYWPDVPVARPNDDDSVVTPVSPGESFPGRRIVSPAFKGTLHTTNYDLHLPRFLDDHRIYGMIVVPGAAHLSMALTAVAQEMPGQPLGLEAINFDEVLVVPDDKTRDIQITLSPNNTKRDFEVFSRASEADQWLRHAWGSVETALDAPTGEKLDVKSILARCKTEFASTDIFYRMLYRQGIQLGRQFQWVERIWKGDDEAITYLRPPEPNDEPDNYFIPPGLLDSIFQSMGATLSTKELEAGAYIPISIEHLAITHLPAGRLVNHVRLRTTDPAQPDVRISDMTVCDEDGNVVARVMGLRIHRAPQKALRRFAQRHLRDAIYAPVWVEQAAASPDGSLDGQTWLIFCDEGDGLEAILARLAAEDVTCRAVLAGKSFTDADDFTICPTNPEDYAAVLESASKDGPIDGIAFLWPTDPAGSMEAPGGAETALSASTTALLHLSRALATRRSEGVPRLIVSTRGAHAVTVEAPSVASNDGGIWGLSRVIANELPETRTLRMDLPFDADSDVIADYLALAMGVEDEEDEIAFRDGRRYAMRLNRWAETRSSTDGGLDFGKPYQLVRSEGGLLEEMKLAEVERPAPAPDEIEILSDAAGVNFRDVLNALAVYPGDAGPMGGEVVGTVTATGSEVTGFSPGDRVMAIGAGTFARHVVTKASMARRLPADMTVEEAATIPVAYVSAWLGLMDMAAIRAGDKVLIHAGAGGVGMAAIMLAKHFGAEVYATASSGKQDILREMGVARVYDSRTLDFADGIMEDTGGYGVDIVLNALANDFIPKSIGITARNGRFVEIGKNRTWTHAQVAAERPDIAYHKMALDEIIVGNPDDVGRMLGECLALVVTGKVKPLPRHEFDITESLDAFRFMQQARHVGKIVLTFPQETQTEAAPVVRPDRAYLVTGGFGAIGLRLAARLADLGAGRIALVGRSGPKAQALAEIKALRAEGAQVSVLQGDVTDSASIETVLAMLRTMGLPIGGVFHAAGILDDATLIDMDEDRFRRVVDPKLVGAMALHRATLDDPIEQFVMFSSAAALFGTPGQSNYAAANAALDALANYRHGQGLPALSVNWGPWAEAGMAHSVESGVEQLWASMGIRAIAPKSAFDTLELLMQSGTAQALVLNADWDRMHERFPSGRPPRMIVDLVSGETGHSGPSPEWQALMEALTNATLAERQPMLTQKLQGMAARVLGLPSADALDPNTALNELGLDSLMAVEFANQISAQSGLKLRVTELFDHPTVDGLATYLLALAMPGQEPAETMETDDEDLPPDLFDSVAGLTDSEVMERLKELDEVDSETRPS